MENILLPSQISFEPGENKNQGTLILEPAYYGYGTTIGNALRRVLLSSLPGAAVTAVKIKGATHEFQAVENVKEDVLEIILNLKALRMKLHTDEPTRLHIKISNESRAITGADIEPNADVEIVNPELHIATVTSDNFDFEMELIVSRGRGFKPTEQRHDEIDELGMIAIDALYSPVRNVGYRVENTRVGEITNYDKLIMNIETDGTVTPEEAVRSSAKVLIDHFSLLVGEEEIEAVEEAESVIEPEVVEESPEEEVIEE